MSGAWMNGKRAMRCAAAIVVVSVGCTPADTHVVDPVVDAVTVSPATKTITVNKDDTLTASATAAGVVVTGQVFTWTSADQSIATVSSSGVVHGVSAGTVRIDAATAGHTGSMQLTVGNPAPTVQSISPSTALVAGPAFTLTVTGSGFVPGSKVYWNGALRPTVFVSSTSLTASITAADIATQGTAQVAVMNAAPAGGTSGALTFTIGSPTPTYGTPTLVKSVPMPTGATYHHDTFVRDGLAFVCAWNRGVLIYDVGNGMKGGSPANPQLVSQIVTNFNGGPNAEVHNAWWFKNPVTGQNKYLFVGQEGPGTVGSASSGDIHIVDVSDLNNPVEVGFIHVAGAGVHNFWMDEANQVLYAAYYNGGVIKVDVSGTLAGDMSSRIVAQVKPGGTVGNNTYIWGVMLANGTLYATDMVSGFWALDPVTLATKGGGNNVPDQYGSDQWVVGNVAYSGGWGVRAGTAGNAVKIWSLGANGVPTLANTLRVPNVTTISDVAVTPNGKMLVLTAEGGSGNGLYVYDRTDPLAPVLAAWYPVGVGLHTGEVAVINGRTYVFAARDPGQQQMDIFDITDVVH